MARVKNPKLFSSYFSLDPQRLIDAGLIDPFINVDTQLFIDPVLLQKSGNAVIAGKAFDSFKVHFQNFVRLLAISAKVGDAPWRGAERLLDLSEPPENGLGYGGSGTSGSSRPKEVRDAIMTTSKEIIELGSKDPEMISLMGFFEENVGPDTISDYTTRVILKELALITAEFCKSNGVPLHEVPDFAGVELPLVRLTNSKQRSILLVPRDIVRELPIANDWSDIQAAIDQSQKIRQGVNMMLSGIAKPTALDRKQALKQFALKSASNFEDFLEAVKQHADDYDPNLDALSYYKMRQILTGEIDGLNDGVAYDLSKGPDEVVRLVKSTIDMFKHHVENGNLWEELWIGGKPKKERASQLIYYAIADSYCKAHNLDITPEGNMGGGPVDFKFSKGYRLRVLVEMKRSSGTVRHGYERQLEIYKDASRTLKGIFVVMDYGDLGSKLEQIMSIQAQRRARGIDASEIIVIDATKKLSASKRP